MVAHNVADMPFLLAVMVQRRPFFQVDLSVMFVTLGLNVLPIDKVELEPCFVVAALVGRADAESFMRNGESTVLTNFPVPIGFRRFKGTHKRQPSCPESIRVTIKVWGWEASARRSRQRLLRWY